MEKYMSVADAKAAIDAECGTDEFGVPAHGDLWVLANLPGRPGGEAREYLDVGIERVDVPEEYGIKAPGFDGDEEAVDHVRTMALAGSALHARALRVNLAADSLRFHIWGAQHVDRRTWPEPEPA